MRGLGRNFTADLAEMDIFFQLIKKLPIFIE